MSSVSISAAATVLLVLLTSCSNPERDIQRMLDKGTGTVTLPPGVTVLTRELRTPPGARNLEIAGSPGTILKADREFRGRAMLVVQNAQGIRIRDVAFDGSRPEIGKPAEMPPAASPFLNHFQNNIIALDDSRDVLISNIDIREAPAMAILAARVKKIRIEKVRIEDSGGRNSRGRNNTTGGILLEEGTEDFEVIDCSLKRVTGNGIWTHSTFLSPRNYRGRIAGNNFETIGRDAVQVGHANRVRVEGNRGRFIGFPFDLVDQENQGIPVAVDTAGKVDEGVYTRNHFEEINGKCFDLDGFHDGEVSENTCINKGGADYPNGHYALVMNNTNDQMQSEGIVIRDNVFDGTKFGGIFVIGERHRIFRNKLRNLNRWRCNEGLPGSPCPALPRDPDLTQAGIYLGDKAERFAPARGNVIEDNEISGYRMSTRCVMITPRLSAADNTIRNNRCSDSE